MIDRRILFIFSFLVIAGIFLFLQISKQEAEETVDDLKKIIQDLKRDVRNAASLLLEIDNEMSSHGMTESITSEVRLSGIDASDFNKEVEEEFSQSILGTLSFDAIINIISVSAGSAIVLYEIIPVAGTPAEDLASAVATLSDASTITAAVAHSSTLSAAIPEVTQAPTNVTSTVESKILKEQLEKKLADAISDLKLIEEALQNKKDAYDTSQYFLNIRTGQVESLQEQLSNTSESLNDAMDKLKNSITIYHGTCDYSRQMRKGGSQWKKYIMLASDEFISENHYSRNELTDCVCDQSKGFHYIDGKNSIFDSSQTGCIRAIPDIPAGSLSVPSIITTTHSITPEAYPWGTNNACLHFTGTDTGRDIPYPSTYAYPDGDNRWPQFSVPPASWGVNIEQCARDSSGAPILQQQWYSYTPEAGKSYLRNVYLDRLTTHHGWPDMCLQSCKTDRLGNYLDEFCGERFGNGDAFDSLSKLFMHTCGLQWRGESTFYNDGRDETRTSTADDSQDLFYILETKDDWIYRYDDFYRPYPNSFMKSQIRQGEIAKFEGIDVGSVDPFDAGNNLHSCISDCQHYTSNSMPCAAELIEAKNCNGPTSRYHSWKMIPADVRPFDYTGDYTTTTGDPPAWIQHPQIILDSTGNRVSYPRVPNMSCSEDAECATGLCEPRNGDYGYCAEPACCADESCVSIDGRPYICADTWDQFVDTAYVDIAY